MIVLLILAVLACQHKGNSEFPLPLLYLLFPQWWRHCSFFSFKKKSHCFTSHHQPIFYALLPGTPASFWWSVQIQGAPHGKAATFITYSSNISKIRIIISFDLIFSSFSYKVPHNFESAAAQLKVKITQYVTPLLILFLCILYAYY